LRKHSIGKALPAKLTSGRGASLPALPLAPQDIREEVWQEVRGQVWEEVRKEVWEEVLEVL